MPNHARAILLRALRGACGSCSGGLQRGSSGLELVDIYNVWAS
jgi:hypothetical protein